jgi:uncharacterized integral membrane protein
VQFLKTLAWLVAAIVLILFAQANWSIVTINLWGGLQMDIKLPVLVIGAFLLGFVPTYILHRTRLWSLRRRLEAGVNATVANAPVVRAPPVPEGEPRANQ